MALAVGITERFQVTGDMRHVTFDSLLSVMSVCLSVYLSVPLRKFHFLVNWRPLVKERIANISLPSHVFKLFFLYSFNIFLAYIFLVLYFTKEPSFEVSFVTSLFWMMGELAGGGPPDMAVGVTDR